MLATNGYEHLVRSVGGMEILGMPVNDGFLQFRDAFRGRVFCEVGLNGLNCGLFDVFRRREVGLAWAKIHNVVSLGLQARGRRQNRSSRTKGNARYSSR